MYLNQWSVISPQAWLCKTTSWFIQTPKLLATGVVGWCFHSQVTKWIPNVSARWVWSWNNLPRRIRPTAPRSDCELTVGLNAQHARQVLRKPSTTYRCVEGFFHYNDSISPSLWNIVLKNVHETRQSATEYILRGESHQPSTGTQPIAYMYWPLQL